ncbi:MAG: AAA family ATPase [Solobacterium sp.]|nr:AAA family ATPase [Solobacterium sp.]
MGRYQITSGRSAKGTKIVLYGVEGVGKTTLAAQMPSPIFIDTEGSTSQFDVPRYPSPTSWEMLLDEIKDASDIPEIQTIVIDSGDWAERLCIDAVCKKNGKTSVEGFGYGQGYTYVTEEYGKLLNTLTEASEKGKNVCIVLHAAIRQFTQPEDMGAYSRYTLELIDTPKCSNTSAVKQWADAVLFANYKDIIIEDDKTHKKYARGGQRMIYTQRTPAYDAKNRFGLPQEIDMNIQSLAPMFASQPPKTEPQSAPAPTTETIKEPDRSAPAESSKPAPTSTIPTDGEWAGIDPRLAQLMTANGVQPIEIRTAVYKRGYFPFDQQIATYPRDFVEGVLIGAWQQVFEMIKDNRQPLNINNDDLPF